MPARSDSNNSAGVLLLRAGRVLLSNGVPLAAFAVILRRMVSILRAFRARDKISMPVSASSVDAPWKRLRRLAVFLFRLAYHGYALSELAAYLMLQLRPLRALLLPPKRGIFKTPSKLMGARERRELFRRCVDTFPNDPRDFVTSWFFHADFDSIKRQNAIEFLTWGFFGTSDSSSLSSSEKKEVLTILADCEELLGCTFPPGKNKEIKYMSFSDEPLKDVHHPALYYASISALNTASDLILRFGLKFNFKRDPVSGLRYYHLCRKGKRPSKPFVFFHGLGIGLLSYVHVVSSLLSKWDPDVTAEIVLVDIPVIASRFAPTMYNRDQFLSGIESILSRHGHSSAHFAGHSFGSFYVAWVCKYKRHLVAKATFLDPVCFLLHLPNTLFDILYSPAKKPFDVIMQFVIRNQVFMSHYLRRHFHWFLNIIFLQQVPAPYLIIVGEDDSTVPSAAIEAHVKAGMARTEKMSDEKSSQVRGYSRCEETEDPSQHGIMATLNGQIHGSFIFSLSARRIVVDLILERHMSH